MTNKFEVFFSKPKCLQADTEDSQNFSIMVADKIQADIKAHVDAMQDKAFTGNASFSGSVEASFESSVQGAFASWVDHVMQPKALTVLSPLVYDVNSLIVYEDTTSRVLSKFVPELLNTRKHVYFLIPVFKPTKANGLKQLYKYAESKVGDIDWTNVTIMMANTVKEEWNNSLVELVKYVSGHSNLYMGRNPHHVYEKGSHDIMMETWLRPNSITNITMGNSSEIKADGTMEVDVTFQFAPHVIETVEEAEQASGNTITFDSDTKWAEGEYEQFAGRVKRPESDDSQSIDRTARHRANKNKPAVVFMEVDKSEYTGNGRVVRPTILSAEKGSKESKE